MGRCLCYLLSALLSLRDGKDSLACEELLRAADAAEKLGSPYDRAAYLATAAYCLSHSPGSFTRLPETDATQMKSESDRIFSRIHRSFDLVFSNL